MELKLSILFCFHLLSFLLIVPYGIETHKSKVGGNAKKLLIVPYGIETQSGTISCSWVILLIVPYGIETPIRLLPIMMLTSF